MVMGRETDSGMVQRGKGHEQAETESKGEREGGEMKGEREGEGERKQIHLSELHHSLSSSSVG